MFLRYNVFTRLGVKFVMNIYGLVVIYNSYIDSEVFKRFASFGITPLIYDNSNKEEYYLKNKEVANKEHLLYDGNGTNLGLPKAYNSIIRKYLTHDDDWLLIFDQDTPLPDEYFKAVLEKIQHGDKLCYMPFFPLHRKEHYAPNTIANVKTMHIKKTTSFKHMEGHLIGINSCSAFNAKVFKIAGLFNEKLFLDYVDNDLFARMAYHNIISETLDIKLVQNFFAGEKHPYKAIKRRLANIKYDAKTFYSNDFIKKTSRLRLYLRDVWKYSLKYAIVNNPLYLLPLVLTKPKHI